MATPIPDSHADLLRADRKTFAHLALTMNDGSPQVTPMWFAFDGESVYFNTARGRVKDRIMRKKPRVAFSIQDPEIPYRYIQVRGQVVEESEEGAWEHICDLCEKYRGHRDYKGTDGQVRVIYKVKLEHANTMG